VAINVAKVEPTPEGESSAPQPQLTLLSKLARVQIGGPHKTSAEDLVLFTQQLALLIQTGIGLVPAIAALASQLKPGELRTVLERVRLRLEEGVGLSESLEDHPGVFNHLFTSIIRAGEASGSLQESLLRLSSIMEIQRRLRSRVREAMTYPTILTCIMAIVVAFMMIYMFPRFSDLFSGIADELPLSTRLLLASGDFLRSRWWIVVPIAFLAGVGARRLSKTEAFRERWDRLKLSLPLVGPLFTKAYMFQLFSSLGILLGSRVPHLEAIGIARKAIENARYEEFFTNLAERVEAGQGVALAFQECSFLPQTVKLMVATGETSGALDTVMARLSEHYREELESDIRKLSSMIEPIMLVIMGVLVGFVAISFIVPLFKLTRGVH